MFIQVPPPIQLKDRSGAPIKVQKLVNGAVTVGDHEAESLYDFAIERLAGQPSTFKEQRMWLRILDKLAAVEKERTSGVEEPWVELDDNEFKALKDKMESLQLGGLAMQQFMPFMDAIDDAKRERPKLKAVEKAG